MLEELAMLKMCTKNFEVVLMWVLEVSAMLKGGGAQKFPSLKRGARKD